MSEPLQYPMSAPALLMLRKRMLEADDPAELGGNVAAVGAFFLERCGFTPAGPADVKVDIGTDEEPDIARITLTWPLPPDPDPEAERLAPEDRKD